MPETKIISAFPGCGKTFMSKNNQDTMLDSDSSHFSWVKDKDGNNTEERNPDFPENYIQHIKDNLGKVDIIFVSSHKIVREALEGHDLPYTLIYPDKALKEEMLARYKERGSAEEFIDFIEKNFDSFIDELNEETYPQAVILPYKENKWICWDVLHDILEDSVQ